MGQGGWLLACGAHRWALLWSRGRHHHGKHVSPLWAALVLLRPGELSTAWAVCHRCVQVCLARAQHTRTTLEAARIEGYVAVWQRRQRLPGMSIWGASD